jgi:hypothetical protein
VDTVAPSARAAFNAAGSMFSQRLTMSSNLAQANPNDLPARRSDAHTDSVACEGYRAVITGLSVPSALEADIRSLIVATTNLCGAIGGVEVSTDNGYNAANQARHQTLTAWNAANTLVFRDMQNSGG